MAASRSDPALVGKPRPSLIEHPVTQRMFISYASNFEDVLLQRVFAGKDNGFYIDIGADHPVGASTTKAFYDRGWHGVNVEPGPHFPLLQSERPRDVNLQAVVTDRDGTVDFFINEGLTATSSLSEEMHPNVSARISERTKIQVRSYSLNTLVREYASGEVDFLKIDAEGAEGLIITAADWKRFRPLVIVMESTEPFSTKRVDADWVAFLARNGFRETYFDGINTWLVREENPELAAHFSVPVNVLDDFVDYEKHVLRAAVQAQAAQQPKRAWYRRLFSRG